MCVIKPRSYGHRKDEIGFVMSIENLPKYKMKSDLQIGPKGFKISK